MAKQKWLRKKECGSIFAFNKTLAKNPKMEVVELGLSKPQEAKPEDTPKPSTKKAAPKRRQRPLRKRPLLRRQLQRRRQQIANPQVNPWSLILKKN